MLIETVTTQSSSTVDDVSNPKFLLREWMNNFSATHINLWIQNSLTDSYGRAHIARRWSVCNRSCISSGGASFFEKFLETES